MKNRIFISLIVLFALFLTSCSSKMEGPIYRPLNADVTFEVGNASYILNGDTLTFKVTRGNAENELLLPITIKDDNNLYTLQTKEILLGKGVYEGDVVVSYDSNAVNPGVDYGFILSFKGDEKAVSGYNKLVVDCSLPHGVTFINKGVVMDFKTVENVTLQLERKVAKKALRVPLILVDQNGVYTLEKKYVDFKAGETKASVVMSYDKSKVKQGTTYTAYIYFDNKFLGNGGRNYFDISGSFMDIDENYKIIGKIKTIDEYEEFNEKEFVLMQSKLNSKIYRIVDFYGPDNIFEFSVAKDGSSHYIPVVAQPKLVPLYGLDKVPGNFAIFKTDATIPDQGVIYEIYMRFCADAPFISLLNVADGGTLKVGSKMAIDHVMYYIQRDGGNEVATLHRDWSPIMLEVTSITD